MGGASDSIPARLARDEPADVVILARSGIDDLARKGYVDPSTITDLARSQIGLAVKSGVPAPNISTRDNFLALLLSAKSIGYSASASGTYLARELFPKLEIYPQIKSKLVRIESERVAAVVARGEVEIGFQQVSEILPIQGASFAGKIPEEMQRTTIFSAGIVTKTSKRKEAEKLIAYLASSQAAATIRTTGLDPLINAERKRKGGSTNAALPSVRAMRSSIVGTTGGRLEFSSAWAPNSGVAKARLGGVAELHR